MSRRAVSRAHPHRPPSHHIHVAAGGPLPLSVVRHRRAGSELTAWHRAWPSLPSTTTRLGLDLARPTPDVTLEASARPGASRIKTCSLVWPRPGTALRCPALLSTSGSANVSPLRRRIAPRPREVSALYHLAQPPRLATSTCPWPISVLVPPRTLRLYVYSTPHVRCTTLTTLTFPSLTTYSGVTWPAVSWDPGL